LKFRWSNSITSWSCSDHWWSKFTFEGSSS